MNNYINNGVAYIRAISSELTNWTTSLIDPFAEVDQQLENIQLHAKNQTYDKLIECLNKLCGPKGNAKMINTNQIQLFFDHETRQKRVLEKLIERSKTFCSTSNSLLSTFEILQFSQEKDLFCLTLSVDQTSVLLGIDPQKGLSETQAMTQQIQRMQQDFFSSLPTELVFKILSHANFGLNIVRSFMQLSKKYYTDINSVERWQQMAHVYGRSITDLNSSLTYMKTLISLCHLKEGGDVKSAFVGWSQAEIEEAGGICLTENLNAGKSYAFQGVILLNGETHKDLLRGEANKHLRLLFFCIGSARKYNFKKTYQEFMPSVIEKLVELKIIPDCFLFGFHLANDSFDHRKYFLEWQNANKKKRNA